MILFLSQFVVRILIARVLRELRRGVMVGSSIPAAHGVVPSLLQLMHMAKWSRQMCSVHGKKFLIPESGIAASRDRTTTADPIPYATLRRYLPLLLRLLLEAELDKRTAVHGDLHAAAVASQSAYPRPLAGDAWELTSDASSRTEEMQVAVSLVEGALVFVCQPAEKGDETTLAVTFPKLATALQRMSSPSSLRQDRPFFVCLVRAILRHKSKLPKQTRDAILESWLGWLKQGTGEVADDDRSDVGPVTSAAHEYLMRLLNDWSVLGNLLLPRDTLLQFSKDAIRAVDAEKFAKMWNSSDDGVTADFAPIKEQYECMLKVLPTAQAEQWKEEVGLAGKDEGKKDPMQTDEGTLAV